MILRNKRPGFTLVELLVVIAIIGILAGFLMPSVGRVRLQAKVTLTQTLINNLSLAMQEYNKDFGVYPPEIDTANSKKMDKPSETLYYYMVGKDIEAPSSSKQITFRRDRLHVKVFMNFKREQLEDHDGDNYYEVCDAWGQPMIYVRGAYPGKASTSSGLGNNGKPFHKVSSFDLYSVGADGKTGKTWKDRADIFKAEASNAESFYKQAANEAEDGLNTSGCKFSLDDIANF